MIAMEWADIFGLANLAVLPAWLYLIAGPRSVPFLNATVHYVWPTALALLYASIVIPGLGQFSINDFGSIAGVRSIFSGDAALTAGWVHYLAFDLFVGGWIARQADALGIWRVAQIPILLVTFMFGPVGFLVFMIVKGFRQWR